jgi:hypothetical protein
VEDATVGEVVDEPAVLEVRVQADHGSGHRASVR